MRQSVLFCNTLSVQHFITIIWAYHLSMALWQIMVKIECHTFLYYHVYLLWDIKFIGYISNHFDSNKITFARQKSTLWISQKKSNLRKIKYSELWKWLLGRFYSITLKSTGILIMFCFSNPIERFSDLLKLKFALNLL